MKSELPGQWESQPYSPQMKGACSLLTEQLTYLILTYRAGSREDLPTIDGGTVVTDGSAEEIVDSYGVPTVSRIDKITGLFCRISSLL